MCSEVSKHQPMLSEKSPRLVTVIAMCYNHERFVIECLESIRSQSFQDFELIVTDDCSHDASPTLIENWLAIHRPEAVFIRHDKNSGLCRILNEALMHSRGNFISMIATDDVWETDKIERQLASILGQPEKVAVVYSDATRMDETGHRLDKDFIESYRPNFKPPSGMVFSELVDGNFIPAMATMIRRCAIDMVGGYDEQLTYEDYDMWLRLARFFEFSFCPGKVARYRIVPTSLVHTFALPTPNNSYTIFKICEKWLSSGLLSQAQRKLWIDKQWGGAYFLYLQNDQRAGSCLWVAALRTWRPKIFLLAITFSLGISRDLAKKFFF